MLYFFRLQHFAAATRKLQIPLRNEQTRLKEKGANRRKMQVNRKIQNSHLPLKLFTALCQPGTPAPFKTELAGFTEILFAKNQPG